MFIVFGFVKSFVDGDQGLWFRGGCCSNIRDVEPWVWVLVVWWKKIKTTKIQFYCYIIFQSNYLQQKHNYVLQANIEIVFPWKEHFSKLIKKFTRWVVLIVAPHSLILETNFQCRKNFWKLIFLKICSRKLIFRKNNFIPKKNKIVCVCGG